MNYYDGVLGNTVLILPCRMVDSGSRYEASPMRNWLRVASRNLILSLRESYTFLQRCNRPDALPRSLAKQHILVLRRETE
jgi:hypothetical protein